MCREALWGKIGPRKFRGGVIDPPPSPCLCGLHCAGAAIVAPDRAVARGDSSSRKPLFEKENEKRGEKWSILLSEGYDQAITPGGNDPLYRGTGGKIKHQSNLTERAPQA